jgi:starch phosphorylase
VNGGLNLSELDGWWAEAYTPSVGWAIGDGTVREAPDGDAMDADRLYRLLEAEVVPEFYERDVHGRPARWLARVRASMAELAPRFSTNRMVREYVDMYIAAAERVRARALDGARLARELVEWWDTIDRGWGAVRFGTLDVRAERDGLLVSVPVDLGPLDPHAVKVELCADPIGGDAAVRITMQCADTEVRSVPRIYSVFVTTTRPASHFVPRLVPGHASACVPAEAAQIHWQR